MWHFLLVIFGIPAALFGLSRLGWLLVDRGLPRFETSDEIDEVGAAERRIKRTLQAWRVGAIAAGFEHSDEAWPRAKGVYRGRSVELMVQSTPGFAACLRIELPQRKLARMALCCHRLATWLPIGFSDRFEVGTTGEVVGGPHLKRLWASVLGGDSPESVAALTSCEWAFIGDQIFVAQPGDAQESFFYTELLRTGESVVSAYEKALPVLDERLAAFAGSADEPESLRSVAVDILMKRIDDAEVQDHNLTQLLQATEPTVRLVAAQRVGDEGVQTLVDLAVDASLAEATRLEAMSSFGGAPDSEVERVVCVGLRSSFPRINVAALRLCGERSLWHLLPEVVTLVGKSPQFANEVLNAVKPMSHPETQQQLVVLARGDDPDIRKGALELLSRAGSGRLIDELVAIVTDPDADPELSESLDPVLMSIRRRHRLGQPGRLTLVEAEEQEGGLTVVDDPEGGLSLPDDSGASVSIT